MIKQGEFTSRYDLHTEGWVYNHDYGECQVWAKDNQRCMWNPATGKVILVYSK